MKSQVKKLIFFIFMSIFFNSATADPVWHCSRSIEPSEINADLNSSEPKENIASFDDSERRTIGIQIIDLFNVYSGGTVSMGPKPLSACFLDRGNPLTAVAMSSLDIDPTSLSALSSSDAIVKSKVIPTRNEVQMESCIANNHPAIGYLPEVVESDLIGPCF
jgi:hypothetical protein